MRASLKIQMLWSIGISILILKNIFIYLFLNWFLICPLFSLLLQDSGNRYALNSIYKDESQCPAVQYKCRRGGRGRPLVWQRQDSDTFKGDMGTIGSNKEGKMQIFSVLPTTLSIVLPSV